MLFLSTFFLFALSWVLSVTSTYIAGPVGPRMSVFLMHLLFFWSSTPENDLTMPHDYWITNHVATYMPMEELVIVHVDFISVLSMPEA